MYYKLSIQMFYKTTVDNYIERCNISTVMYTSRIDTYGFVKDQYYFTFCFGIFLYLENMCRISSTIT